MHSAIEKMNIAISEHQARIVDKSFGVRHHARPPPPAPPPQFENASARAPKIRTLDPVIGSDARYGVSVHFALTACSPDRIMNCILMRNKCKIQHSNLIN